MLFTKRNKREAPKTSETLSGELYSPVNGKSVRLESVNDQVFSQKILGDGLAFYSDDGFIYSPAAGVITTLAETNHAIGLKADSGAEIMIHVGIDTVELDGQGFEPLVKAGDRVPAGKKLLIFNIPHITQSGFDPAVIMVVSESDSFGYFDVCAKSEVKSGDTVIKYQK